MRSVIQILVTTFVGASADNSCPTFIDTTGICPPEKPLLVRVHTGFMQDVCVSDCQMPKSVTEHSLDCYDEEAVSCFYYTDINANPTELGCCDKHFTAPQQCPYFPQCPCPDNPSCPGQTSTTPAPSPSCTVENHDSWETGVHMLCCKGLVEIQKDWDGTGRFYWKCLTPSQCTQDGEDPYASGPLVSCCDGLTQKNNNWDGDDRWYYKCVVDSGSLCRGQGLCPGFANGDCLCQDEGNWAMWTCSKRSGAPVNTVWCSLPDCQCNGLSMELGSSSWDCPADYPYAVYDESIEEQCASDVQDPLDEAQNAESNKCYAKKTPCNKNPSLWKCSNVAPFCILAGHSYCDLKCSPAIVGAPPPSPIPIPTPSPAGRVEIRNPHSGMCLDLDSNGNFQDGTKAQIWECSGWDGQMFEFHNGEIINVHSGKCLDIDGNGNFQDGTKVQLWDCQGVDGQQWEMVGGEVKNIHSGKCLDIDSNGNFLDGTKVQIWGCSGWDGQLFEESPASASESPTSGELVV